MFSSRLIIPLDLCRLKGENDKCRLLIGIWILWKYHISRPCKQADIRNWFNQINMTPFC